MADTYTPNAPTTWNDWPQWCRLLANAVNAVINGKINAVGTVTLEANQASTTVADLRAGPTSTIVFMPQTANAAAELATMYVATQDKESFTISHASNAQTDRDFRYAVLGG